MIQIDTNVKQCKNKLIKLSGQMTPYQNGLILTWDNWMLEKWSVMKCYHFSCIDDAVLVQSCTVAIKIITHGGKEH